MKKIALFAVAALIGTASFAAPKVVKHTAKKAAAKTETVAPVKAPKANAVAADTTKKTVKTAKAHKKTAKTVAPKAK